MTTSSEQDPRIAVAERALPEPTLSPEMLEEMVLHTGDIEGQSHPLVTPETEEQSVQALRKEVDDIEARERSIDDLEAAALFVDPHFAKILSRTLHPAGKAREISQPGIPIQSSYFSENAKLPTWITVQV